MDSRLRGNDGPRSRRQVLVHVVSRHSGRLNGVVARLRQSPLLHVDMTRVRITFPCFAIATAGFLAACASGPKQDAAPAGEIFDADDTYSRNFTATPAQACEAARRALLGQGYTVSRASGDAVEASKNFQPDAETHTQLDVRATCVPKEDGHSLVFVNA